MNTKLQTLNLQSRRSLYRSEAFSRFCRRPHHRRVKEWQMTRSRYNAGMESLAAGFWGKEG